MTTEVPSTGAGQLAGSAPSPHLAPARLLLVSPDPVQRQWARSSLQAQQHQVQERDDAQAIEAAGRGGFELLLMHPSPRATRRHSGGLLDAWAALHSLRQSHPRLPVLVLHPGSDSADRSVALELGADAVLDTPCQPRELCARVLALLRRTRGTAAAGAARGGPWQFGGWQLDPSSRRLQPPSGPSLPLSHAECRLLQVFLRHPRHTLDRSALLDLARGDGVQQLERSIDLLVSRLRHKLGDDPQRPQLIRTVRGVGYLFEALQDLPAEPGHAAHPAACPGAHRATVSSRKPG